LPKHVSAHINRAVGDTMIELGGLLGDRWIIPGGNENPEAPKSVE